MAAVSPNLAKDINLQITEAKQIQKKKSAPRQITLKAKDKVTLAHMVSLMHGNM